MAKSLGLTCCMQESCTTDGRDISGSSDLTQRYWRTVMWLHPDSFWIGVLHAEKKWESESEDGDVLRRTYSDNTSILAASSNDLVPMCHRTSASVLQSRLTADTVCTMRGCSPEEGKR